jgi:hypothetical protein
VARLITGLAIVGALCALTWQGPVGEGGRYGAGAGAVCGTDGQCRAYSAEVLFDLDRS